MTFKQGFAYWSMVEGRDPVPGLLEAAAEIGLTGVDFLPEELWPQARAAGLELVAIDGHWPLEVGFIDRENHARLGDDVRRALQKAVDNGAHFVTVASGDRNEKTGDDALSICVEGIAPLAQEAEQAGVTLLLEPLNTKVDHAGHECDTTAWAAEVVDRVGSAHLKILYDFYHAQIMEGDLVRTVEANLDRIGHLHTAGVPGRHELDDGQEINYRGVAGALRRLGYSGYVVHEFLPTSDPIQGLKQAYAQFA
ncbi:MAG TPA: TIM barrel protein [Actinoplanes sp.]|nr:TIM barrel protein [Actinoplanes sp.]